MPVFYSKKMNHINEMDHFSTSDITLAATLHLTHPIVALETLEPKRVGFFFVRNPDIDGIIQRFWAGDLRIEPRSLMESLRTLKARLREIN